MNYVLFSNSNFKHDRNLFQTFNWIPKYLLNDRREKEEVASCVVILE